MELKHFSHKHPLIFNHEWSHESEAYCSGCGKLVSSPCFSCVACNFHLHQHCAEAPSKLNHPFHRNHNFKLRKKHPYSGTCPCDFCNRAIENFVYHCSSNCELDLHIQCALLTNKIAEKRIDELQHIPRMVPMSNSTENHDEELNKAECFACWKSLLESEYLSPDCGFFLHVKCVDLPTKINHFLHPKHPLFLQFNSARLLCEICQKSQWRGLVYSCSLCEFVLHIHCSSIPYKINQVYHRIHPLVLQYNQSILPCQICLEIKVAKVAYLCSTCKFIVHSECVSPPSVIEDKDHHDHPFNLLQRRVSLNCDACGTSGDYVPYTCSTCNIVVHKKCISLPRIILFYRHRHPLFHIYFLEEHEFRTWECQFCNENVDVERGSYFCSVCNYIVHVNCVTMDPASYYEVKSTELQGDSEENETTSRWIDHSLHGHDLALGYEDHGKQCDGCLLPISTSYYCCSECDFFLHKSCAELPLKRHIWFSYLQKPFNLTWDGIFRCSYCAFETSGFGYDNCDDLNVRYCLRCALVPEKLKYQGHEHPLNYYHHHEGVCEACGSYADSVYRCKKCDFDLHTYCLRLPLTVQHQSDEHPLKLTYKEKNDYSEHHYCDVCEKVRDPTYWFYQCSICDNSMHTSCVIGEFYFIKLGSIYMTENHPHQLRFVKKVQLYPKCCRCGHPCRDLSLECKEIGCNYIVHWECIKPLQL